MFLKEVNTIFEFKYLMKVLEKEMPNLRWRDGQKPTGWIASDIYSYPKRIYIQESTGKLACWESAYDSCRG